jgi:hypothetical protein
LARALHSESATGIDPEPDHPDWTTRKDVTMNTQLDQWSFKEGDEVRSADDRTLGKIVGFWPSRPASSSRPPPRMAVSAAGVSPGSLVRPASWLR